MRVKGTPVVWAEQLDRLELCPAGAVFFGAPPRNPHTLMRWFVQFSLQDSREVALYALNAAEDEDAVNRCEQVGPLPLGARAVTYGYDPMTGKAWEAHNSPTSDTTQFITADCVFVEDGCPHATIFYRGAVTDLDPASDTQLLGIMVAIRKLWSDPWELTPPGELRPDRYIVSCVGILEDGTLQWNTSEVDDDDLDDYSVRARQIQQRVIAARQSIDTGNPPQFHPNAHCGTCDHHRSCPTRTKGGPQ